MGNVLRQGFPFSLSLFRLGENGIELTTIQDFASQPSPSFATVLAYESKSCASRIGFRQLTIVRNFWHSVTKACLWAPWPKKDLVSDRKLVLPPHEAGDDSRPSVGAGVTTASHFSSSPRTYGSKMKELMVISSSAMTLLRIGHLSIDSLFVYWRYAMAGGDEEGKSWPSDALSVSAAPTPAAPGRSAALSRSRTLFASKALSADKCEPVSDAKLTLRTSDGGERARRFRISSSRPRTSRCLLAASSSPSPSEPSA